MRKIILFLTVALLAVPALARKSHNNAFVCGDDVNVTGTQPLYVFDQSTGFWCPSATINEDGIDVDVVIEGDTDANLFTTDAGNERVGISTPTPAALLDVRGPAGTGAAAAGVVVLATDELAVIDGDQLGCVNFQAPLESSGTDAILVGAGICAEASATFSATVNTTDLVFKNGVSEAAAETVRILANGVLVVVGVTADPCAGTVDIGGIFYNSTSNYHCFCNGAGADIKMNDNTTACF